MVKEQISTNFMSSPHIHAYCSGDILMDIHAHCTGRKLEPEGGIGLHLITSLFKNSHQEFHVITGFMTTGLAISPKE